MTEQERIQYQNQMRNLKLNRKGEMFRLEHHQQTLSVPGNQEKT